MQYAITKITAHATRKTGLFDLNLFEKNCGIVIESSATIANLRSLGATNIQEQTVQIKSPIEIQT